MTVRARLNLGRAASTTLVELRLGLVVIPISAEQGVSPEHMDIRSVRVSVFVGSVMQPAAHAGPRMHVHA